MHTSTHSHVPTNLAVSSLICFHLPYRLFSGNIQFHKKFGSASVQTHRGAVSQSHMSTDLFIRVCLCMYRSTQVHMYVLHLLCLFLFSHHYPCFLRQSLSHLAGDCQSRHSGQQVTGMISSSALLALGLQAHATIPYILTWILGTGRRSYLPSPENELFRWKKNMVF